MGLRQTLGAGAIAGVLLLAAACAESPSKSFCRGDDGGPAMDAIGAVVYGVMSWNADGCPADTTVRPNVYAEVSSVRDWIVQNSV